MTTEIRSEDAAETRTVTGWCCKRCGHFWGSDKHMAQYCCATDFPCECGVRISKCYVRCQKCEAKKADARWAELLKTAVKWDGETPLCTFDDDRYFFGAEDLESYLDNLDPDDGVTPETIRLVLCKPDNGCTFEMEDYLADHLPDDDHGGSDLDTEAIDKTVNDWIAAHAPFCWHPTNQAVTIDSSGATF